ncbi:MAG: hypothetical protein II457_00340 [Paludibacteraceae bacterium]|nr:hypothetical protein [Paludibacteraceae bacterium]
MYFKHLQAMMALAVAVLLAGCRSDIDLKNIDKKAEVEVGMALPIGTIHATMGDFLGNGKVKKIVVDEEGIFHYIDTVNIPTKEYHSINVANYVIKDKNTLEFPVASKLAGIGNPIPPSPEPIMLEFDLELGMEGINNDQTQERIDSIWVTEANFISKINITEDFGLNWSDINKVELVLTEQFRRPEGKIIEIPVAGKGYDQEIPIDVNNFTLSLLKNNEDPDQGTVDKILFKIRFYVQPTTPVPYTDNSKFKYNLQVKMINYAAIWGYFEAGNQMRNTDTICLAEEWKEWENVKKLKVRFAEPMIDVFVSHRISAPLIMHIDYITAIDSLGNPKYATWKGETSKDLYLKEYMSPLTETLQDSVLHHETFSYKDDEGHIDELFDVRPDSFMYSFTLYVDQTKWKYNTDWRTWKQIRVLDDVSVRGFAVADVPFKFNEGSEMAYKSNITGVNLSRVTLDSLLADAQILDTVKTSDLKLVLVLKNRIPFDIYGTFTFLDKDSVDMKMQLVDNENNNRIHMPAPKMERPAGQKYGYVSEASETTVIVSVEKKDFDRFAQVKQILFDASIAGNPQPCVIDTTTDLSIKIGIAAKVDAILDFSKDNKK